MKDSLKGGHAISTVARNLGVIAAALAHSKLPVSLIYNESAILAKWPELKPKAARQIFEPTDEELARLLKAPMPPMLRRWLLNSMATGGRPEAVLQLSPASRQRDLGLIDLNPEGRRQNKKYRATVRELRAQSKWLDQWEREDKAARTKNKGLALQYSRYACVDSIDTALQRLRMNKEVNLPRFSSYSIRHRVASVLRSGKVPGEQISFQMGHRKISAKGEARTTRNYGQFDPDYLEEAAKVLEAWVGKVLRMSRATAGRKLRQAA